jgi:Tfp pilus assembly protein PilO
VKFPKHWPFVRMDLVGVAAALVASAAFYWAGIRPMMALQEQQQSQLAQLQNQQHNVALLTSRVEQLQRALESSRQAFTAIGIHLEPADTVNARISQLMALATKNGLKIDSIQPNEPAYAKDYGSVPIVLTGAGGFPNWGGFLHELSESFADTSVDTFDLTSNPAAGQVAFRVTLLWYVTPKKA